MAQQRRLRLAALLPALAPGGRFCAQVPLLGTINPAAVLSSLRGAGLLVQQWRVAKPQPGCGGVACSEHLEVVAVRGV